MKFRKFIAATTRDCLRMMREALGADALIVSTRRTSAGVEVVGIRAQDMPLAEDPAVDAGTPAASAPAQEQPAPAAATAPALWDDMEEESVRLSPAARVLAQHEEKEHASRPAVPPSPTVEAVPLASWPRVDAAEIPHLVRGSGEFADQAHAMAVAAAERETAKPVLRLGAPRGEAEKRAPHRSGPKPSGVQVAHRAAAPSRLDEQDREELASRVAEPIVSEMRSMRDWLAHQMDAMAWRDSAQRQPLRREIWRRMVDCGFTPELARSVATHLPASHAPEEGERWLAEVLVRNLACVDAQANIVEQGGRYAIVGPTGVGKTTTAAKIAAHCVVKYGAGSLGLISTDQQRIGAVDQLRTFGRMLGVEVYVARGGSELEVLLGSMADRRLVLIDTAGVSQRDAQIGEHLRVLDAEGVQRLLVVPGGSHAEQAEDIVRAYSAGGLAGMIVSKLDEAVRLGGVLDAAIRHRVPLHYMTNGQRVPEDIHAANARLLVHRALRARNARVFALEAEELEWAMAAPAPAWQPSAPSQTAAA